MVWQVTARLLHDDCLKGHKHWGYSKKGQKEKRTMIYVLVFALNNAAVHK